MPVACQSREVTEPQRDLSAKLTEGEKKRRIPDCLGKVATIQVFSPSVKTFGFATSLIRGRQGCQRNFKMKRFFILVTVGLFKSPTVVA